MQARARPPVLERVRWARAMTEGAIDAAGVGDEDSGELGEPMFEGGEGGWGIEGHGGTSSEVRGERFRRAGWCFRAGVVRAGVGAGGVAAAVDGGGHVRRRRSRCRY